MHSNWRDAQEWKREGIVLTTGSNEACKLYDAIVTQYVGWYDDDSLGGMEGTLKKLKEADEMFVMGQVVVNGLELLGTCRNIRLDEALREDVSRMMKLANSTSGISEREVKHAKALDLWANGLMGQATCVWEDIIVDNPHDILALKFVHDSYFYMGKSLQMRDSIARVLPTWLPSHPHFGYIHGMHSFGLEETNLYQEAEEAAEKALTINPRDGWATHSLAHIMEMTGRQQRGIDIMESTVRNWETCGMLACHNHWHAGLYQIELGNYEAALAVFDTEIKRRATMSKSMLDMVDVCSFLFRLQMEDVDIGDRWHDVYNAFKDHIHDHVLMFNDMHILLACLGAGQKEAAKELMTSIETFVKEGRGINREITGKIGLALVQAFAAYDDGDFATAVEALKPIRYNVVDIGGSHAQRDLVSLFLIQAAIKSPSKAHHRFARSLLNERKVWKTQAPMTDRLMAKALAVHAD